MSLLLTYRKIDAEKLRGILWIKVVANVAIIGWVHLPSSQTDEIFIAIESSETYLFNFTLCG